MAPRLAIRRKPVIASLALASAAIIACGVWAASPRADGKTARAGDLGQGRPGSARTSGRVLYPLKMSNNRRYLVDRHNVPFMIVGDSPQALIGKLSVKDAAGYIANRKAAGFNTLWVNLLCTTYTGCRADGSTFDGIKPFTSPGDLATPNIAYFRRADTMIQLAAKAGIVVLLDPIETGGWLGILRENGVAKAYAYGRFLGRRYKSFANIVWFNGNDFQTWRNPSDDALVLAVANGIRSVDHTHIHTVELDYPISGSLENPRWKSKIQLNAAYTYLATYAKVLEEYNRKQVLPVFMVEASYEFEQNNSEWSKGDPGILRRQEYWSALSGSTGQLYGNHYTWQFIDGWKDHLDTRGTAQLGYLLGVFAGRRWFDLVPDQDHTLVTAGYGTFSSTGNVGSSDYVTTASTPDGTLALSYLPAGGTVTVDMGRFAGVVRARWYDPTKGTYSAVPGAPFPTSGTVALAAPGKNGDGDSDWVLVLTSQ